MFVANKHIHCSVVLILTFVSVARVQHVVDQTSFQVLTTVSTHIVVFWALTPCNITGASDVSDKHVSKAVSLQLMILRVLKHRYPPTVPLGLAVLNTFPFLRDLKVEKLALKQSYLFLRIVILFDLTPSGVIDSYKLSPIIICNDRQLRLSGFRFIL
jgi:hypothetical protein